MRLPCPWRSSSAAGVGDSATDDQPLTREEARHLLAQTEAIYRSVTASRRRIATAALILVALFGLLTLISGFQWLQTRSQIEQVADEPLVEALGVEIPDPRPAFERGQLRLRSMVWGLATAATATTTLLFGVVYLLARPPQAPMLRPEQDAPPPAPK